MWPSRALWTPEQSGALLEPCLRSTVFLALFSFIFLLPIAITFCLVCSELSSTVCASPESAGFSKAVWGSLGLDGSNWNSLELSGTLCPSLLYLFSLKASRGAYAYTFPVKVLTSTPSQSLDALGPCMQDSLKFSGALWNWMELPEALWGCLELCPQSAAFLALFFFIFPAPSQSHSNNIVWNSVSVSVPPLGPAEIRGGFYSCLELSGAGRSCLPKLSRILRAAFSHILATSFNQILAIASGTLWRCLRPSGGLLESAGLQLKGRLWSWMELSGALWS